MGYRPRYINPYLWLRPSMKMEGFEYYKYILCCVYNVLCIYHNPRKLMKRIQEYLRLKDNKIELPDIYLGDTLARMKLDSGNYCWTMSSEQYVKAAVTNFEEDLSRSEKRFPSKCVTPLSRNYAPWLEDSLELMEDGVQRYQELIVQIIWAVDIRRLNILLETSLLSSYLAMPWVRHLKQAFHIFGYLKARPKRKLVFYPAHPAINKNRFQKCDWTEFYRDSEEAIPEYMPVSRGNLMLTHCFVDVNHAGDTETRRSHTVILFFSTVGQ